MVIPHDADKDRLPGAGRFSGVEFTAGDPPFQVFAILSGTLEGLNVYVGGGEAPHIGSVAISIPRPSLADPEKVSCTTSVYNCIGHKDDVIATMFSEELCKKFRCTVVVTAGVHTDHLSPADIKRFLQLGRELLIQVEEYIGFRI